MNPWKIEMIVSRYNENREPFLYALRIYDSYGKIAFGLTDISKEVAIKYIAEYCSVTL